jgi:ubiquinone/menaquinone biosynthesis C-methylase UbiE/uncharacterized protein YbaR (Trm112 family)
MKRTLLSALSLGGYSGADLELTVEREDAREVREGRILSKPDGRVYPIHDGILDLLAGEKLAPEIRHEKEHQEAHPYLVDADGKGYPINPGTLRRFRDVFLSLPAGDGSHFFQPGGSFDNQAGNAERFFKILDMLGLKPGTRVLEVGASFGWGAWRFAQRGCEVVALDVANFLIAADLYFEADGAYFDRMIADMNRLPFRDQTFDLIFSHSVIHHCKEIGALFGEFRRVLRPGGRVVALHECSFGLFEDRSGKALQEAIDEGFNENAYTIPEWKRAARKGGFRNVRAHFFSFIDDYIYRKELRRAPRTPKLAAAYWIRSHGTLHRLVNDLSALPRTLLRPKSWALICTK